MIANYGYKDGSGDYFIAIDTDKCDGCGKCVDACPGDILKVLDEDPNDPFREEPFMVVVGDKRKKIKYECGPCKPPTNRPSLPCIEACPYDAISHSW